MITGSCGPIKWTKHPRTYFFGGRSVSSSTLDSCKSKTQCVDNSNCTGIVWKRAESACWLHGPSWSDGKMLDLKGDPGIDYYELTRNVAQTPKSAGKCHASLDLICTVDAKIFTNYQKKKLVTLFWSWTYKPNYLLKKNCKQFIYLCNVV